METMSFRETELYDDIFNQIAAVEEDYSEIHEDNHDHSHSHLEKLQQRMEHTMKVRPPQLLLLKLFCNNTNIAVPILTKANGHIKESSVESDLPRLHV